MSETLLADLEDIKTGKWRVGVPYLLKNGSRSYAISDYTYGVKAKLEGRNYYIEKEPLPITESGLSEPIESIDQICLDLTPFNGKTFNLYKLICSRLRSNKIRAPVCKTSETNSICLTSELKRKDCELISLQSSISCEGVRQAIKELKISGSEELTRDQIVDTIIYLTENEKAELDWTSILNNIELGIDKCTSIGSKISKSLIKIASQRIFAEPEQSIMELPVNSVDAYNPAHRIGKFGMGFFSFLYFLVGHPKRSLYLESFYQREGKYCSYRVRIFELDGDLSIEIKVLDSQVRRTGLLVHLDASLDKFNHTEELGFEFHIDRLKYVKGAKLSVANGLEINHLLSDKIGDLKSSNLIYIDVSEESISVEDYATGISLFNLLNVLFVPSISTKTLKLSSSSSEYFNQSRIEPATRSRLLIVVAGISIVTITDTNPPSKNNYDYIIDLPPDTRLPVSRDDVILPDNIARKNFEDSILKLYDSIIEKEKDVSILQDLLEKYTLSTVNDENRNAIKNANMQFFTRYGSRLIPSESKNLQKFNSNFILSKSYNIFQIENYLAQFKSRTDIWHGKKVILTDTVNTIEDFGLYNYIFLPSNQNLDYESIENLTLGYSNFRLYPIESNYATRKYREYLDEKIDSKSARRYFSGMYGYRDKNAEQLYLNLMSKIEELAPKFSGLEDFSKNIKRPVFYAYVNLGFSFADVISTLIGVLSNFRGSDTYGGNKEILVLEQFEIPRGRSIPKELQEKYRQYNREAYMYNFLAVEEAEPVTKIAFFTALSMGKLLDSLNETYHQVFFTHTNSYLEFMILTISVGYILSLNRNNLTSHGSIVDTLVRNMSEKVRSSRPDLETFKLYFKLLRWSINPSGSIPTLHFKLKSETVEWVKFVTAGQTSRKLLDTGFDKNERFVEYRSSQLIEYLFREEIPNRPDLFEFFTNVSKVEPDDELQLLQIVVNEGTTKPFIEAVLTELVQNSYDALREIGSIGEIEIDYKNEEGGIRLNVSDPIGMNERAFISIGVPFLSTKTPSEFVTGEMGSGFFNVYRESEQVSISTGKDNNYFASIDKPIRDDRNRVIDIKRTFFKPDRKSAGTIISLKIPASTLERKTEITNDIRYYTLKVLSLMDVPIFLNPPSQYELGRMKVNLTKELFYRSKNFEIYLLGSTESTDSYLLTKGVPFRPLREYYKKLTNNTDLIDTLSFNTVINVRGSGYTPVQSRTNIRIPTAIQKEFDSTLWNSIFIRSLKLVLDDSNKSWMLPNINSNSQVEQIKFPPRSNPRSYSYSGLSSVLQYYQFVDLDQDYEFPALYSIINSCIDIMGTKRYSEVEKRVNDNLDTLLGLNLKLIIYPSLIGAKALIAVKEGDIETLKSLMAENEILDLDDLISLAIKSNQPKIVSYLVSVGSFWNLAQIVVDSGKIEMLGDEDFPVPSSTNYDNYLKLFSKNPEIFKSKVYDRDRSAFHQYLKDHYIEIVKSYANAEIFKLIIKIALDNKFKNLDIFTHVDSRSTKLVEIYDLLIEENPSGPYADQLNSKLEQRIAKSQYVKLLTKNELSNESMKRLLKDFLSNVSKSVISDYKLKTDILDRVDKLDELPGFQNYFDIVDDPAILKYLIHRAKHESNHKLLLELGIILYNKNCYDESRELITENIERVDQKTLYEIIQENLQYSDRRGLLKTIFERWPTFEFLKLKLDSLRRVAIFLSIIPSKFAETNDLNLITTSDAGKKLIQCYLKNNGDLSSCYVRYSNSSAKISSIEYPIETIVESAESGIYLPGIENLKIISDEVIEKIAENGNREMIDYLLGKGMLEQDFIEGATKGGHQDILLKIFRSDFRTDLGPWLKFAEITKAVFTMMKSGHRTDLLVDYLEEHNQWKKSFSVEIFKITPDVADPSTIEKFLSFIADDELHLALVYMNEDLAIKIFNRGKIQFDSIEILKSSIANEKWKLARVVLKEIDPISIPKKLNGYEIAMIKIHDLGTVDLNVSFIGLNVSFNPMNETKSTRILIKTLVQKWLYNKNTFQPVNKSQVNTKNFTKEEKKHFDEGNFDQIPDKTDEELGPFITKWIEIYWDIASELKLTGFETKRWEEIVVVRSFAMKSLGRYIKDKKIIINTLEFSDYFDYLKECIRLEPIEFEDRIRENPTLEKLLIERYPSATVPHEIEHARRYENVVDCVDSKHGEVSVSIKEGKPEVSYRFSDITNEVWRRVKEAGFYQRFCRELRETESLRKLYLE